MPPHMIGCICHGVFSSVRARAGRLTQQEQFGDHALFTSEDTKTQLFNLRIALILLNNLCMQDQHTSDLLQNQKRSVINE